ncbi:unnamed protein product, partial [marine sediment metagenome]
MSRFTRAVRNGAVVGLVAGVILVATRAGGGEAPAEKPKPTAKSAPGLLDIPQVARDQVICFALYTVHH